MQKIRLQAHAGLESESPENTASAFRCACAQGYDVIELDLGYTCDKKIVALHDVLINRTARNGDGTPIDKDIRIHDITYEQALQYDFGIGFSKKYKNEKIPLFRQVLELAKESGVLLKIDNKIQSFPEEMLAIFFEEIKEYTQYVSVTSNDVAFIKKCLSLNPDISIDYDGLVTEPILQKLRALLPYNRLTVWLPYECDSTSWVKIPFADEASAALVKKYARLGVWLLNDYDSFYDAKKRFRPDVVETNGVIKPEINVNCRYDMHVHSKSSHDSECEVSDIADSAAEKGLTGFAVTDHIDVEYCREINLNQIAEDSLSDVKSSSKKTKVEILRGVEIGETFWDWDVTENIIGNFDWDVVIGSVHAVKFPGYEEPYSCIDFAEMGKERAESYLDQYFTDMLRMLQTCDIDVLAHMTCPLRYINGKFGLGVDCKTFKEKITTILKYVIKRGVALEINTSCLYEGSRYSEYMPEAWIVRTYKDFGGYLITTGSDAHVANKCANRFDELYRMLKETGFKNTYYYKNRRAIPCAIV